MSSHPWLLLIYMSVILVLLPILFTSIDWFLSLVWEIYSPCQSCSRGQVNTQNNMNTRNCTHSTFFWILDYVCSCQIIKRNSLNPLPVAFIYCSLTSAHYPGWSVPVWRHGKSRSLIQGHLQPKQNAYIMVTKLTLVCISTDILSALSSLRVREKEKVLFFQLLCSFQEIICIIGKLKTQHYLKNAEKLSWVWARKSQVDNTTWKEKIFLSVQQWQG